MDLFYNIYREKFQLKFKKLGFKRKGKIFYRVTDEIFQGFKIVRKHGNECDIEFVVIPLCIGITKEQFLKLNGLGAYELNFYHDRFNWNYDKNYEISINNCLNSLMEYVDKYMIPFFENSLNCEAAFEQVCRIDKDIFGKVLWTIPSKHYMLLKSERYDLALKGLRSLQAQNISAYKANINFLGKEAVIKKWKAEKKDVLNRNNLIQHIKIQDFAYVRELIVKNESLSRFNLGILT